MKTKEQFRLPYGGSTTNIEEYCVAWKNISNVLEKYYDLNLIGFDPGYLLARKDYPNCTVDIPMWLAKKMVEVATQKTES